MPYRIWLDDDRKSHVTGKLKRRWRGGRQFAALPLKEEENETFVLLITSRETERWVIPKGWAEKRRRGPEVAANEAYEEAGVVGQVA